MKYYIGQEAFFSKTISESDVYMFAGITGDFNPVHIDKVSAEKSIFKERIVHGALTAALISTVLGQKLPGEGTVYLEQHSKFVKPVKIGDTLTAKVVIDEIVGKKAKLLTTIVNQDNVIVLDGMAMVLLPTEQGLRK